MASADLYPTPDGKYVIDRSLLPVAVRAALDKAMALDSMVKEARREAFDWEREGRASSLVAGRRKLAATYEQYRDEQVELLWTLRGREAPGKPGFEQLVIREGKR